MLEHGISVGRFHQRSILGARVGWHWLKVSLGALGVTSCVCCGQHARDCERLQAHCALAELKVLEPEQVFLKTGLVDGRKHLVQVCRVNAAAPGLSGLLRGGVTCCGGLLDTV